MSSIVNFLPLFLLFAIIAWIYISYTVLFCFYYLENPTKRYSYVVLTQILLVFFLWSLFETICQDHQNAVPPKYKINLTNYNEAQFDDILRIIIRERGLQIFTRTDLGLIRYCRRCRQIKPDRTHHCSQCKICVLKMDHHCPWIHNCVGHLNQKQFVLTLFYGTITCLFFIITIIVEFRKKNLLNFNEMIMMTIGFGMTCIMGITSLFLFIYNLTTVLRNQTTIETLRSPFFAPDYLTFDQSVYENFSYVFGDQILLWFIPITTASGNGYEFPVRVI